MLSSATANAQGAAQPRGLRVIFVGNSLTYVNDLPEMVKAIAKHNHRKFEYKTVAFADHSLEDHLKRGDALATIKKGRWDFVVLQQGSSALPESRAELLASAERFAKEIRAAGARPAFFMVWPFESRKFDFDRVHDSYAIAAERNGAVFIPAGNGWQEAWKEQPPLKLYADGLHASPLGSFLAAAVIYRVLFDDVAFDLPIKFSKGSTRLEMPVEQKDLVRRAAIRAK